jgi:uncharacterized membrane protein SpoIIM required for sporulation
MFELYSYSLITCCILFIYLLSRFFQDLNCVLGAFAKFRKATISFVIFVRLSVCPHGTTLLPLDGFS